MAYYRYNAAELASLLHPPVSSIDDVGALYERLGAQSSWCSETVRRACELVYRANQQTSGTPQSIFLASLYGAISRWALEALTTTDYSLESVWSTNSGSRRRAFTAAQCRGILANIILVNVNDPVGQLKPPRKLGGLRLDRRMLTNELGANKMACLLQYFITCMDLEGSADDNRSVIFERRTGEENLSKFEAMIRESIPPPSTWSPVVLHDGFMESIAQADAFCNFANPVFGYGEFIASATQEEIMQVCCPEFNVGMLFISRMQDAEVIVVHGCRRYSRYQGYQRTFQYNGPWLGMPRVQSIPTMDAVSSDHFTKQSVLRDIQKAKLCFDGHRVVSTGKWGCGAFGGLPAHKLVQQMIAAMMVRNVQLYFSTHGATDGCDRIVEAVQALRRDPNFYGYTLIVRMLDALLACCDLHTTMNNNEFVDRFLSALRI